MPKGAAIYFACDTDGIPADIVLEYWRGATAVRQAGFHLGGYGPHAYVAEAIASKVLDAGFIAGGWENGQPDTGCALKQFATSQAVGGVTCDVDEVLDEYGAGLWNRSGLHSKLAPPAPHPTPPEENVQIQDVTVTCPNGHGSLSTSTPFAKVASWDAHGGQGVTITAECQADAKGNTEVSVNGAKPGQDVKVRLAVLS